MIEKEEWTEVESPTQEDTPKVEFEVEEDKPVEAKTEVEAPSDTEEKEAKPEQPEELDGIEKVKVEYIYKMEFGYETIDADIKTQYSTSNFEDVSWMLTKDLDIAEVKWVVQYKITNPYKYLFKVI